MATITINIPDAVLQRVLDGYAHTHGYQPTLENGTTETKAQFARRKIIEHIKSSVRKAEVEQAYNNAVTEAAQKAESEINLT